MIRITQQNELLTMYIKMNFTQTEILDFLAKKGYEVKGYCHKLPYEKGFLLDEPQTEYWTFTATKNGEKQSPQNLYLKVFEKEVKEALKI